MKVEREIKTAESLERKRDIILKNLGGKISF